MRKTIYETVQQTILVCDFCKADYNVMRCRCCGRDTCKLHRKLDLTNIGEWDKNLCVHCHALRDEFEQQIRDSRRRANEALAKEEQTRKALFAAWKAKSWMQEPVVRQSP